MYICSMTTTKVLINFINFQVKPGDMNISIPFVWIIRFVETCVI